MNMTAEVFYYSRSGNTKKLAEAVAGALGVSANEITENSELSEKTDVVYVGSSLYAGSPDKSVYDFIEKNAEKIGTLAVFGSSASGNSTYKKLKAFAEARGIHVFEKFYNCPGHFLFMHKDRPDENDLKGIAQFARVVRYKSL